MSVVRMGAGKPAEAAPATPQDQIIGFLGRFTKWIPGDILVLYAATVTLMQPAVVDGEPTGEPVVSVTAWLITLVATPVVAIVAAWLAGKEHKVLRAAFALPAFAVWSATVPHSAWERWPTFSGNPALIYLVLGIVALILPPIAEKVIGDS